VFPALDTIQTLVAPVVMISANGLLCLAFYNRLGAIINRSRTINKERFDLLMRLATVREHAGPASELAHIGHRVEVLDELGHQLLRRARWLRGTLVCLLLSVLAMLACSLALGLSLFVPALDWAALALFVAGALVMGFGILLAIYELRAALDPLVFEHERIERSHSGPPGAGGTERAAGIFRTGSQDV
jgi:hypothetical protein